MTGREKIIAGLSPDGTPEIPAVICYDMIFIRDHWAQVTGYPWWYMQEPDLGHQLAWLTEYIQKVGLDWRYLTAFMSAEERKNLKLESQGGRVFRLNSETGEKEELHEPEVSGGHQGAYTEARHNPQTEDEVTAIMGATVPFNKAEFLQEGRADLAKAVLDGPGREQFGLQHIVSPLAGCFHLWGFEEGMVNIAVNPDLMKFAAEQYLAQGLERVKRAAACGVHGIWIEETMTDMISPEAFKQLNVPLVTRLVEAIHIAGLKSIYYYCGNPAGKLEHLISTGTDAISLEEGKKGFTNDIEEIVTVVNGRCALLGNLDSIGVLEQGSEEELRTEIGRQITAGRKNNNRFIMSIGSPVTPGTTADRVRLYADLAHELGK